MPELDIANSGVHRPDSSYCQHPSVYTVGLAIHDHSIGIGNYLRRRRLHCLDYLLVYSSRKLLCTMLTLDPGTVNVIIVMIAVFIIGFGIVIVTRQERQINEYIRQKKSRKASKARGPAP
jgi:hypothetical protein